MYLDKPLRDHTLLQAICRTNRPYGAGEDPRPDRRLPRRLRRRRPGDPVRRGGHHAGRHQHRRAEGEAARGHAEVPRATSPASTAPSTGYEGLIAAQECLPNNETRDRFAADFSYLSRLWEAISPDPILSQYETDYRWLVQVYESVKPSTGTGQAALARAGRQDHRADPRERPRRCGARRSRDPGARCRPARGGARDARPEEEGQGDRDQGRRAAAQAPARSAVQGARRAARGPQEAARAGAADERRVPEGAARPGQGRRRDRAERRRRSRKRSGARRP